MMEKYITIMMLILPFIIGFGIIWWALHPDSPKNKPKEKTT
jgi:hypothetical protein